MFLIFGFLNDIFGDSEENNLKKNSHSRFSFEEFTRVSWQEHINDFTKMVGYPSDSEKKFTIPKTTTLYGGKSEGYIDEIGSDFLKSMFRPSDSLRKLYEEYQRKCRIPIKSWFGLIETIIIPNSVKIIKRNAFSGYRQLENLKTIIIPDSVTEIGSGAFYNIQHIEYHGSASGAPWGAKSMN